MHACVMFHESQILYLCLICSAFTVLYDVRELVCVCMMFIDLYGVDALHNSDELLCVS